METKKWYQSKTILVGLAETIIGINVVVTEYLTTGNFNPIGVSILIGGILQVFLRTITKLPIE